MTTVSRYRLAGLLAGVALVALVSAPALAAPEVVGTAAAVNPAARANDRTIELGANVVHKERIRTTDKGSVQVLFVDHTTLNIGPNSDLVIDEFVYDPATRTGRMAATLGKGVLRFVGGQTSHTNGATIRTPTTTLAIRGGVSTIIVNGEGTRGVNHFGTLTFNGPGGSLTIARPDFTSIVSGLGNGPTSPERVSIALLQSLNALLTSKPGQSGGAKTKPTQQAVQRAGVGQANAGLTPRDIRPDGIREAGLPPPSTRPSEYTQEGAALQQQQFAQDYQSSQTSSGTGLYDGVVGYAGGLVETRNSANALVGASNPFYGFLAGDQDYIAISIAPINTPATNALSDGTFVFSNTSGATTTLPYVIVNGTEVTGTGSFQSRTSIPSITTCSCQYAKWGYWTADTQRAGGYTDTIKFGSWVAGIPTPTADIDGLAAQNATATYNGHAMAAIQNGASQAFYAGQFSTSVNFGTGNGTFNITNLAGKNYSGSAFAGNNYYYASGSTTPSTYTYNAMMQGYFYGPGAAELGGQLTINSNDPAYYGSGTFVAKR